MQRYDFRGPRRLADDVEHLLERWQDGVCESVNDRWQGVLAGEWNWLRGDVENVRGSDLRLLLPEGGTTFRIQIGDQRTISLLGISRAMAIDIVSALMGGATEEDAGRSLTQVEASMLDFAMKDIEEAFFDAQPSSAPLAISKQGTVQPRELPRIIRPEEVFVMVQWKVQGRRACHFLRWFIPQASMLAYVSHISESKKASNSQRQELEQLVQQIPATFTVRLGSARLSVLQLAQLRPGDVIMLDQRLQDALVATVGQTEKFRGWPGRIGTRQTFRIEVKQ